jgi:hypothetical protein
MVIGSNYPEFRSWENRFAQDYVTAVRADFCSQVEQFQLRRSRMPKKLFNFSVIYRVV